MPQDKTYWPVVPDRGEVRLYWADSSFVLAPEAAREFAAKLLAVAEMAECPGCQETGMHPRHKASDACESGKRSHCTCDTCF